MTEWLAIILLSAIVGAACAWRLSGRTGLVCSGAVPWLGVALWIAYLEQQPYRGGGASMWLIALLWAGAVAAAVGIAAYLGINKLFRGFV